MAKRRRLAKALERRKAKVLSELSLTEAGRAEAERTGEIPTTQAILRETAIYTQAMFDEILDQHRTRDFMKFVDHMPAGAQLIYGTADQVRAIVRTLRRLGFH